MKVINLRSIILLILGVLVLVSCNKNEDEPHPLFAEIIYEWVLVSGVETDLSTKEESTINGTDDFRMRFIFNDEKKDGYIALNGHYSPFQWTTNEDKRTIEIDTSKGDKFTMKAENVKVKNRWGKEFEFTDRNTHFKGQFITSGLNENTYSKDVIGKWSLQSVSGWVMDDGDKIPVNRELDVDQYLFEFKEKGVGNVTISETNEMDFESGDIKWKLSYSTLIINLSNMPSGTGNLFYIDNISSNELILADIDEDRYLVMKFKNVKQ